MEISEQTQQLSARTQELTAETLKLSQEASTRDAARLHAEHLTRLRDRFTAAAAQMGDASAAVRLAGSYAMGSLADEWLTSGEDRSRAEAQVYVDILTGYLRTQRDIGDSDVARQADAQIRQTIVRIIRDHLQEGAVPSWEGFDLDFTGAVIDAYYSLEGARFTSGHVSFKSSRVQEGGVLDLASTHFSGARVSFFNATLCGTVRFSGAVFDGSQVDFLLAVFASGAARFLDCHFDGALVSFQRAQFGGSYVRFRRSHFAKGEVSFASARFTDGRVSFTGTTYGAGALNFFRAKAERNVVAGPWGEETPPARWPLETTITD